MSSQPLVSVVVPTRNSTQTLDVCLKSIMRQSYSAVEIVVVDNHSTDDTREIASKATSLVLTYGPERSAQRNAGIRASSGQYIAFIDSDMVLDPIVVEQCMQIVGQDTTVKGIIIPERSIGEGFWAHCKTLERRCYVGDDTIEAARFFDRTTLEAVGGYDEALTAAEDWDLSRRVRELGQVKRIQAGISHLEGHLTLGETMRGKFYYGKTLSAYIRKQPTSAARQFQLIRPAFVRHWRSLLAHPLLLMGMIVMKVCEFAAGGAGMSVAWWQGRSGKPLT